MSIQYRAAWQDNNPQLIDVGRSRFQDWVDSKDIDLDLPLDGHVASTSNDIRVDNVEEHDIRGLRIRLNERRSVSQGQERWSTTALWMTKAGEGWVWLDLEWVSDDVYGRPPDISAPRLAIALLDRRETPLDQDRRGPTPLEVITEGDIADLIEWLYSEQRTVPLILYSFDGLSSAISRLQRPNTAARRLAGCADVRVLTSQSQVLFHRLMAPLSLSVYDGAVRIYFPGLREDDPQPSNHRFFLERYLSDAPFTAATPLVRRILPRMIAQQPPELYRTKVGPLISQQERDWREYAMELDVMLTDARDDIRRLNRTIDSITLDHDIAIEEAALSEQAANKAKRLVDVLQSRLRESGENPDVIEQDIDDIQPNSCREAIALGSSLEYIDIHEKAARDIEVLDSHEHSVLWGQRVYTNLRALNSYAEYKDRHGFVGGFKDWCDRSGSSDAISASKFFAAKESKFVRTNRSLMRHRSLPIDTAIDPSGHITMQSHLKPVQGGGMQIPRVYFHDDTRGHTRKIHIGFIGPHSLMPNKSAS